MEIDARLIGFINTFETLTRSKVKDAFFDENNLLVFVIVNGDIGRAIGRAGSNIRRLASILKKRIRAVEFNEDPVEFVKNCIFPIKPKSISKEDNIIKIEGGDSSTKAMLMGRDRKNLKGLNRIVRKYFDVEVKVI